MPSESREWVPRERWDALVRGDDCPKCADLVDDRTVDAYVHTIADLSMSHLRLAANQAVLGYCVTICHRLDRDPYHLSREEQTFFFGDLMRSARALDAEPRPVKKSLFMLGEPDPALALPLAAAVLRRRGAMSTDLLGRPTGSADSRGVRGPSAADPLRSGGRCT